MSASLIVIYWRDIPAQVTARAGRANAKRELPVRFQEAIDMAAMRGGARDTDAYLAEWRRGAPEPCDSNLDAVVEAAAAKLDALYDAARLKALVDNGGREPIA